VPLREPSWVIRGALKSTGKICTCAFNLSLARRFASEAPERLRHQQQCREHLRWIRTPRNDERTRICVLNAARTDVVDQAAILAQLKEESACRAIAEDR
jgi:hypothetical protein